MDGSERTKVAIVYPQQGHQNVFQDTVARVHTPDQGELITLDSLGELMTLVGQIGDELKAVVVGCPVKAQAHAARVAAALVRKGLTGRVALHSVLVPDDTADIQQICERAGVATVGSFDELKAWMDSLAELPEGDDSAADDAALSEKLARIVLV